MKRFRILAASCALSLAGEALALDALAQTPKPKAPATTAMQYFRYPSADQCNVYMNYSSRQPNFSLRVVNPNLLSPQEIAFVREFNAKFQAMATGAGMSTCVNTGSGFNAPGAQDLYTRCMSTLARLGAAEESWVGGRMPAPSNCISPVMAADGTVMLLSGFLAKTQMSVDAWMAKAQAPSR